MDYTCNPNKAKYKEIIAYSIKNKSPSDLDYVGGVLSFVLDVISIDRPNPITLIVRIEDSKYSMRQLRQILLPIKNEYNLKVYIDDIVDFPFRTVHKL